MSDPGWFPYRAAVMAVESDGTRRRRERAILGWGWASLRRYTLIPTQTGHRRRWTAFTELPGCGS